MTDKTHDIITRIDADEFALAYAAIDILCGDRPDSDRPGGQSRQRLASLILAKHIFGEDITIGRDQSGRPRLSSPRPERLLPPISVSHGAGIIALAWSKTGTPVGVDVEAPREQLLRVYSRFLRPEECPPEITLPSLLRLWTMKEAAWKAMTVQPPSLLDVPLDRFAFHHYPIATHDLLTVAIPS